MQSLSIVLAIVSSLLSIVIAILRLIEKKNEKQGKKSQPKVIQFLRSIPLPKRLTILTWLLLASWLGVLFFLSTYYIPEIRALNSEINTLKNSLSLEGSLIHRERSVESDFQDSRMDSIKDAQLDSLRLAYGNLTNDLEQFQLRADSLDQANSILRDSLKHSAPPQPNPKYGEYQISIFTTEEYTELQKLARVALFEMRLREIGFQTVSISERPDEQIGQGRILYSSTSLDQHLSGAIAAINTTYQRIYSRRLHPDPGIRNSASEKIIKIYISLK